MCERDGQRGRERERERERERGRVWWNERKYTIMRIEGACEQGVAERGNTNLEVDEAVGLHRQECGVESLVELELSRGVEHALVLLQIAQNKKGETRTKPVLVRRARTCCAPAERNPKRGKTNEASVGATIKTWKTGTRFRFSFSHLQTSLARNFECFLCLTKSFLAPSTQTGGSPKRFSWTISALISRLFLKL